MTDYQTFPVKRPPEVEVPLDLLVREHTAIARKLQAEAMAETIATAWYGLDRAVRTSFGWLAEQYRRAETRSELMACSDRTLADIGIAREHINLAARGVDVRDPVAVRQSGLWPRLAASIQSMRERRREQLAVYRELSSYNDRELDEIGVRRSDLAGIARAA